MGKPMRGEWMFKMNLSRLYSSRRHTRKTNLPRGRPPKEFKKVIV